MRQCDSKSLPSHGGWMRGTFHTQQHVTVQMITEKLAQFRSNKLLKKESSHTITKFSSKHRQLCCPACSLPHTSLTKTMTNLEICILETKSLFPFTNCRVNVPYLLVFGIGEQTDDSLVWRTLAFGQAHCDLQTGRRFDLSVSHPVAPEPSTEMKTAVWCVFLGSCMVKMRRQHLNPTSGCRERDANWEDWHWGHFVTNCPSE